MNKTFPNLRVFFVFYVFVLQLLYVDRTKCDEVPVYRERSIFKNWKGFLIARETKEASTGGFGCLELMPPYKDAEKEEAGEGFFNVDDKEEKVLETKEVRCINLFFKYTLCFKFTLAAIICYHITVNFLRKYQKNISYCKQTDYISNK